MKKHIVGHALRLTLLFTALLTLLIAGCNKTPTPAVSPSLTPMPTSTPTPTPTPVFSVACKYSSAMAGQPDAAGNIPALTNCSQSQNESLLNFIDFLEGDFVSAGEPGEAVIDIENCARIYVFRNSILRKSTCAEINLGSTTCSISGTSAYNNNCDSHLKYVYSTSARYEFIGTYATITINPENNRSTIIVLDGLVSAQPVLDTSTFTLGDPVEVQAGQFWYTEPGQIFDPDRRPIDALPLSELPNTAVLQDILFWMGDITTRLENDAVPVPEIFSQLSESVLIRGEGDLLANPSVSEAVLTAVNWDEASRSGQIDESIPILLFAGSERYDTRSSEQDFQRSAALLEEAGIPGGTLIYVLTNVEDELLSQFAEVTVSYLEEVGFQVEFVMAQREEMSLIEREILDSGESVLVFDRAR